MQIEEPFGILALGAPCLLSQRTPRSLQHSSMSLLAALSPCSRSSKQGQTRPPGRIRPVSCMGSSFAILLPLAASACAEM